MAQMTPEQMAQFMAWQQAQAQAQAQQAPQPQQGYAPPPAPQAGWGQAPQYPQAAPPGYAPPVTPQAPQFSGELGLDLNDPSMSYEDGQFGVPPGQYHLRVEKLERSISKRSGNETVKARFRVTDGPHKNAIVTCVYPIKKASQRLRGLLETCLGKGQGWDPRTGVIGEARLQRCCGIEIMATVTQRLSEDGETTLTSVGGHKAVAVAAPQMPQVGYAPPQAGYAPQMPPAAPAPQGQPALPPGWVPPR